MVCGDPFTPQAADLTLSPDAYIYISQTLTPWHEHLNNHSKFLSQIYCGCRVWARQLHRIDAIHGICGPHATLSLSLSRTLSTRLKPESMNALGPDPRAPTQQVTPVFHLLTSLESQTLALDKPQHCCAGNDATNVYQQILSAKARTAPNP